jgi:hypothetical protein
MWKILKVPFFFERMLAFSVPKQNTFWVMSHDELFQIILAPEVCISTVLRGSEELDGIFDEDRSLLTINDQIYPMLGLYGGVPILINEVGDQLSLEPTQERLVILTREQQVKQIIEFSDLSGDWRWATFSADGRYLLIGVPYDLFVYQWVIAV